MSLADFPHADRVSREYGGVPVGSLVEIFHLEREFHRRILETESPEDRKRHYRELYERVHVLKQRAAIGAVDTRPFDRLVLTFRRELANRSVLEVGCGNGIFLTAVANLLPHGELWGLDTSGIQTKDTERLFRFLQQDITNFIVPRKFDVVFSHQVFEHIAPADIATHLHSIHVALERGGHFIACLPNRYWGPQDITRILDNTYRGRIPAQGSHLNESSYLEMVPLLENHGFRKVRTVIPFGAFIPGMRRIRVRPWLNQLLERSASLRAFTNVVASKGRPIFKNPIILVCEKAN
jgi:SAM-dependent methyltransferase